MRWWRDKCRHRQQDIDIGFDATEHSWSNGALNLQG